MPAFPSPAECPICGEPVPKGARACPNCGADERSGWNEEATRYDGIDLPDSEERGAHSERYGSQSASRIKRGAWAAAAIVLILALLYLLLRG